MANDEEGPGAEEYVEYKAKLADKVREAMKEVAEQESEKRGLTSDDVRLAEMEVLVAISAETAINYQADVVGETDARAQRAAFVGLTMDVFDDMLGDIAGILVEQQEDHQSETPPVKTTKDLN